MRSLLMNSACIALVVTAFAGVAESRDLASPAATPTPSPATTCALGETGIPGYCNCVVMFAGDSWLTRLDPADCSDCDVVQLTTAHVWLRFIVAGDVPVSIRIVGAAENQGPDLAVELCPSTDYVLSPPGTGLQEFILPLPEGCCITGDTFLQVIFPQGSSQESYFFELATSGNDGCGNAFYTEFGFLNGVCNWTCNSTPPQICVGTSPAVMNVEAECCLPTPTDQRTWGAVKAIYR